MGVEIKEGAAVSLDGGGNVESVRCPKCDSKYKNPLMENNYRKIDKGCELRMSRGKVEIRCLKCEMSLITITP
jgi:hypothetical protein